MMSDRALTAANAFSSVVFSVAGIVLVDWNFVAGVSFLLAGFGFLIAVALDAVFGLDALFMSQYESVIIHHDEKGAAAR